MLARINLENYGKILKKLLPNRREKMPEIIKFENIHLTDQKEIAAAFNNYFVESINSIDKFQREDQVVSLYTGEDMVKLRFQGLLVETIAKKM